MSVMTLSELDEAIAVNETAMYRCHEELLAKQAELKAITRERGRLLLARRDVLADTREEQPK